MHTDLSHSHSRSCYWDIDGAAWVCTAGQQRVSVTLAPDERDLVDVRDMIIVHTAMLREFRLAPEAVARVAAGDRKRVAAVDDHLGFLCELLHHHHAGEDALLWPTLRERVPDAARALIDDAEAQHAEIDAALQRVNEARTSWAAQAGAHERDLLVTTLQRLHAVLVDHLELEERTLLPLAASALTVAEWHAIGEAGVAAMPKSKLPLAFGMFAYEGDPAVLRSMLQAAPALPRVLLPRVAPRVYARRAAKVYGTARP